MLSIKQASDDDTPTPKEIELLNSANDAKKRHDKRKAGELGTSDSFGGKSIIIYKRKIKLGRSGRYYNITYI